MKSQKHILVAPLNWGLGHATRCIPIINALLSLGYKITLASDGDALKLLKKEFPQLPAVPLPGYTITYSMTGKGFKRKILSQTHQIQRAIRAEHQMLKKYVKELQLDAVISDNRFGMYSGKIPSVIISHQLTLLSGKTTRIASFLNRRYLNRFTECWVPDHEGPKNLSGLLGHPDRIPINVKYIGPLSRMKKTSITQKYDIAAILSGPEPQRSLLEEKLILELRKYNGEILIVQGLIGDEEKRKKTGNIEIVNFLTTTDLEIAMNASGMIISRSGYTTVMDLEALRKKAFFIPTPGQTEQEYLAHYFKQKKIIPFVHQDDFKIKDLSKVSVYKGFTQEEPQSKLVDFFGLFEGKGELGAHSKFTFNVHFFLVRLNNMLNNRQAQT